MEAENFKNFLLLNGKSPSTAEKIVLLTNKYLRSGKNFEDFLVGLKLQGVRNTTLNWYTTAFKDYQQYIGDPVKVKYFKKQEAVKATMSDSEIERFLDCKKNSYSLFWKICAFTGMRTGEVASLKASHVDFGRGIFIIEHSKTGVPRNVPIPPNCLEELVDICKTATDYLFVTHRNCVFSDHSWSHDFKKRVRLIGLVRPHLTPYSLRHSFATRMLEADVNIHKLAKLLGHHITMTAKYEHLTTADIKQAIKKDPMQRKNLGTTDILKSITTLVREIVGNDSRFRLKIEESENSIYFRVEVI